MSNIKIAQSAFIVSPSQGKQPTCICCRIKFDSVDLQRGHFKTEWHQYNIKRKVCHLDPIDLDSFNEIQASIAEKQDDDDDDDDDDTTTLGDDWSEIDEDELIDEDYDDEEVDELLERVVEVDTCLFCDKKSSNCKRNIVHMNEIHGFFIPEEKHVIDINGLLFYLGFKVGAGTTCLWCNKQFTTLHGVRLHMLYKDHCKILYDQENASEFKEFYDYSSQEKIEMKPPSLLVAPRKRPEVKDNQRAVMVRDKQLTIKKDYGSRAIKKFNEYRAKILIKTCLANNNTKRSRIRLQNPI